MGHVWMVYWFDRGTESLAGEKTFEALSDDLVAQILAVPPDQVLGGEWPIDTGRAGRLGAMAGFTADLTRYDYFLGAIQPPGR
jgi:hypothetical protein